MKSPLSFESVLARKPTVWIVGAVMMVAAWSHYRTPANLEQECARTEAIVASWGLQGLSHELQQLCSKELNKQER